MNLFKKKDKIQFETKHVVEWAFKVNGVDYYCHADPLNGPYERALTALVFYKEMSMNIDHEFLQRHVEATHKLLTSNPIDVFKIKQLNDLLLQRIKLPKDPELLYKLASVVYFDGNESPVVYDFEYGKKKIEFWKQNASVKDFFLQKPLVKLMPFLQQYDENLDTFFQVVTDYKKTHLEKVLETLSVN